MHQYTENIPGGQQGSRFCEQQTSLQMNVTKTHQSDRQPDTSDTARRESAICQGSKLIQTVNINTYINTFHNSILHIT
jgi:hypothetical protein